MDNTAQIDYWNGAAGQKWVREADGLDAMLLPFAHAVLDAAQPSLGEQVIDIGCGAGALTLLAAKNGAKLIGVDVSAPLIDLARLRAAATGSSATFQGADASAWKPPENLDLAISRFGVMFFADPVQAFSGIRAGMKPGGRLAFACWRPLLENEWALAPMAAAASLLKAPPAPPPPGSPGPFSFGDADHVRRVLAGSGWSNVRLAAWDGKIEMPGLNEDETAEFMLDIGPLSRAIAEQELDRSAVKAAIATRVRELSDATGRTSLKAAVWIVEASA